MASTDSGAPPTLGDAVGSAISALWPLVLLRGLLLILLGIYAVASPGMTLVAFTQVLGFFIVVDGILALVAGLMGWVDSRVWMVIRGILGILVGVFVFGHAPVVGAIAATVIVIIIAVQSIAAGILEIVAAIRHRKEIRGEGWLILGGVLSILFGVVLMTAPFFSSLALIRIVGVFAIVFGISLAISAFRIRGVGKRLKSAA